MLGQRIGSSRRHLVPLPRMTGVDSPHTHRKFSSFSLVVVVIVVVLTLFHRTV